VAWHRFGIPIDKVMFRFTKAVPGHRTPKKLSQITLASLPNFALLDYFLVNKEPRSKTRRRDLQHSW